MGASYSRRLLLDKNRAGNMTMGIAVTIYLYCPLVDAVLSVMQLNSNAVGQN